MAPLFRDVEGELLPVPPVRSISAIKRASMTVTRARLKSRSISPKEHAALRAYQYALTMTGNDCGHSISMAREASQHVTFGLNVEGRSVPRHVNLGGAFPFEIPHWDFVPDEPRWIIERPAYRAPERFYSSASAMQMAA